MNLNTKIQNYLNKMNWQTLIIIATLFFVMGQVCLKYNTQINSFETLLLFSMTMGFIAFIIYISKYNIHSFHKFIGHFKNNKLIFLGGLFFLIGNGFWISGIYEANNLGLLRAFMTAFETSLLLLVSYFLFNSSIQFIQFIGVLFVLFGMYLLRN